MEQQRSQVRPNPTRLEHSRYRADVQEDILSCVDEKTRNHSVGDFVSLLLIGLHKLARTHRHLPRRSRWHLVGDPHWAKPRLLGAGMRVVETVGKDDHRLRCESRRIQNEVGSQNHVIRKLVALSVVPRLGDLVRQSAQTGPWTYHKRRVVGDREMSLESFDENRE